MSTPTWIVTANFLDDGAVAWRRADGTWSRKVAEAGPLPDEATARTYVASAIAREQREVCDPYPIEVELAGGVITPLSARERIRANGPTIRLRRPDEASGG
jgi:uncharacterized protein DUF2849